MGNFRILEHPSDVGILAWGDSRERALIAASAGLTSIIVDPSNIQRAVLREFRILVEEADPAAHAVNWLNEILFYFDTENLIFDRFFITSWSATVLEGGAWGERFDPERHVLRTAVKAVTYHQFSFERRGQVWELRVFVDV